MGAYTQTFRGEKFFPGWEWQPNTKYMGVIFLLVRPENRKCRNKSTALIIQKGFTVFHLVL